MWRPLETEMLEFTRKISVLRLPHLRALAPLLASAIVAIAVVALLTTGGHGGTRPSRGVGAGAHHALAPGQMRAPAPARPASERVASAMHAAAVRARRRARCGASRGAQSRPRPRCDRGGGGVRPRGVGRCDWRPRSTLRASGNQPLPVHPQQRGQDHRGHDGHAGDSGRSSLAGHEVVAVLSLASERPSDLGADAAQHDQRAPGLPLQPADRVDDATTGPATTGQSTRS